MNEGMYSSRSREWGTPQAFFDELDAEFHFTLDACATAENAKCSSFWSLGEDALAHDWPGVVFMNPPYGREIGKWVAKAHSEAMKGSTVVCLLPARTDTRWWHDWVLRFAVEIRYIRGRLRFEPSGNPAPMPSAVAVFRRLGT